MQKKFNKLFKDYLSKNKNQNLEINTINRFVKKKLKSKVLSYKYNYNTRYMEDSINTISRWSKSYIRNSFANSKAKEIELPLIESDYSYFADGKEFILCLSNNSRISVELTYGKLEEKIVREMKHGEELYDSIILIAKCSYNPWHYFTEILTLANELIEKKIFPKKKIYLPYNPLFNDLIKLIDPNHRIKTYRINKIYTAKKSYFLEGIVGEVLLTSSIDKLVKKISKELNLNNSSYNFKDIYIGRNDTDKYRNRRKILYEKKALNIIKKKYPEIKVIRPGLMSIIESIKFMYNCKNVISPLGTQLVLNCLFSKNLKKMIEMVPELYKGFTTGELIAKFKKSKYKKISTKNVRSGWPLYTNQKINLNELKKIL